MKRTKRRGKSRNQKTFATAAKVALESVNKVMADRKKALVKLALEEELPHLNLSAKLIGSILKDIFSYFEEGGLVDADLEGSLLSLLLSIRSRMPEGQWNTLGVTVEAAMSRRAIAKARDYLLQHSCGKPLLESISPLPDSPTLK